MNTNGRDNVLLIFSGGIGLGAYQGGAYATLLARGLFPTWVAGSSIGSMNAAVIAGSPREKGAERLEELWQIRGLARSIHVTTASPSWRHMESWSSAIRTRLLGSPGHFRPRIFAALQPFQSIYDLAPLRERIMRMVDFERLNGGDVRMSVATTDIETGELVVFDTARGDRITIDHLLASCGYLPEFAPVQIGNRWLGDGGLSANAPVEALDLRPDGALTCFVVDLFARDGARPTDLETATARKNDLLLANQTWQRLEGFCREERLRRQLGRADRGAIEIYYLSYRADRSEAGAERIFDYSPRSIVTRWQAGEEDMAAALAHHAGPGRDDVNLVAIRRAA